MFFWLLQEFFISPIYVKFQLFLQERETLKMTWDISSLFNTILWESQTLCKDQNKEDSKTCENKTEKRGIKYFKTIIAPYFINVKNQDFSTSNISLNILITFEDIDLKNLSSN